MGDFKVTGIIDENGYCSVHKSYSCECYRSNKVESQTTKEGQMECPHGPCICDHCKGGCPNCTIDELKAGLKKVEIDRDEWKDSCRAANWRFKKAETQNKVLREALQPFANFACNCGECLNCAALKALKATS